MVPRKPRFPVSWPLMYRGRGDGQWHPARSTNISLSGILFRAEAPLPIDSEVELRIWIEPPGIEPTLVSAAGKVVRADDSLPDAVAVMFEDDPYGVAQSA